MELDIKDKMGLDMRKRWSWILGKDGVGYKEKMDMDMRNKIESIIRRG